MDKQIDILIQLSGNNHRYQYFALILTFFLWINTCFTGNIVPILVKPPLVTYINSNNVNITEPLTYDICDKYKFTILSPPHSSWVLDFEIYCDRTKTGLIGSFIFAGYASGAFFFPVITNHYTHKPTILLSIAMVALFGAICTYANDFGGLIMVLMVFHGMFSNFCSYSSLIAIEEIVSAEKRILFGNIINMGYSYSGIVFVGLFYYLNNWLNVYFFAIVFILFIGFIILLFSYDSPRGFIIKGNATMTLEILRGIAQFNNRLSIFEEGLKDPECIKTLKDIENGNITFQEINKKKGLEMKLMVIDHTLSLSLSSTPAKPIKMTDISVFSLIKYSSIRIKFLALCFLFFCTNSIYYGIAIGAKSLPGNFYFNMILLYVIESLSFLIVGILTNIPSLGRKKTLLYLYIIAIICMIFLVLIHKNDTIQLILFLIARFCVAGSITTFYSYALENYPTPLRTIGFGINTTCGNIGAVIIPVILEHVELKVLLLAFAGIMVIDSFVLMICLKETVGLPMPETIEE